MTSERVTTIVAALGLKPASPDAWVGAALAVGSLPDADANEIAQLAEGIARIDSGEPNPWVAGAQQTLLNILAGRLQALARQRSALRDQLSLRTMAPFQQTILLHLLEDGGPVRLFELAAGVGAHKSQVSRALTEMVESGWVEDHEIPDGDDRRARVTGLTPRGRALAQRLRNQTSRPEQPSGTSLAALQHHVRRSPVVVTGATKNAVAADQVEGPEAIKIERISVRGGLQVETVPKLQEATAHSAPPR